MGQMNNENNAHKMVIPLGSLTTDNTQVPAGVFPQKSKIKSAYIQNGADLAASDTDFVQVSLMLGATVLAEMDSRAAHENGLVKNVGKALNIASADVPAGSSLHVDYQEAGTVGLTNAVLVIETYPL